MLGPIKRSAGNLPTPNKYWRFTWTLWKPQLRNNLAATTITNLNFLTERFSVLWWQKKTSGEKGGTPQGDLGTRPVYADQEGPDAEEK